MLHGWGGSKTDFESSSPAGGYNNIFFARQGYAVLNYTARGFGDSCGGASPPDHSGPCGKGYIHLADTRFEARDTQYLLGLLADQGLVKPGRIGVTGVSYGGGQSMELAFLRDQIRRRDGDARALAKPRREAPQDRRRVPPLAVVRPRRRPAPQRPLPGHPGRAAGAEPEPGRRSDPELHQRALRPRLGQRLLLRDGAGLHPMHRPRRQPPAGFRRRSKRASRSPRTPWPRSAAATTTTAPTAWRFLPGASRPAPLLIQNGWTDDLFPAQHALRPYNLLRSRFPGFPVSLQFGDLGHSRGSNKAATNKYFFDQAAGFFERLPEAVAAAPGAGLGHRLHTDLSLERPRRRSVQGRELAGDPRREPGLRLQCPQRPSPRPAAIRTWRRSSIRSVAPRTPARRSTS